MPRLPKLALVLGLGFVLGCAAGACATGAVGASGPASPVKASAMSADPGSAKAAPQQDFLAEREANDRRADRRKDLDRSEDPSVFMTALSFVSKLAVVLALAYLTILGLKRMSLIKPGVEPGKKNMRVLENLSLGTNRQLHLVETGSRTLVIASTPSRVSLIAELSPDEVVQVAQPEAQAGFGQQLKMFMGTPADGTQAAGNVAQVLRDSGAFLRDKAAELGGLRKRMRSDSDD